MNPHLNIHIRKIQSKAKNKFFFAAYQTIPKLRSSEQLPFIELMILQLGHLCWAQLVGFSGLVGCCKSQKSPRQFAALSLNKWNLFTYSLNLDSSCDLSLTTECEKEH